MFGLKRNKITLKKEIDTQQQETPTKQEHNIPQENNTKEKQQKSKKTKTTEEQQKSKVILITGASSGIGKATALEVLREGHKVYALGRNIDQMEDIEKLGGIPVRFDLTEPQKIKQVVSFITDKEPIIDVLFNCAGRAFFAPIEQTPMEEVRNLFEVNFFGLTYLTQLLIPHFRTQEKGLIINVSAVEGSVYSPLRAWYQATKHALEGWNDTLRLELMDFKIKVVLLQPNFIQTNYTNQLLQVIYDHIPKDKRYIYDRFIKLTEKEIKDLKDPKFTLSPNRVGELVANIISTDKPKKRYKIGRHSKYLSHVRNYLGDTFFDLYAMIRVED